jgi:hypothetical protein
MGGGQHAAMIAISQTGTTFRVDVGMQTTTGSHNPLAFDPTAGTGESLTVTATINPTSVVATWDDAGTAKSLSMP